MLLKIIINYRPMPYISDLDRWRNSFLFLSLEITQTCDGIRSTSEGWKKEHHNLIPSVSVNQRTCLVRGGKGNYINGLPEKSTSNFKLCLWSYNITIGNALERLYILSNLILNILIGFSCSQIWLQINIIKALPEKHFLLRKICNSEFTNTTSKICLTFSINWSTKVKIKGSI